MHSIRLDYDKTIGEAKKLSNVVSDYESINYSINSLINKIQLYWQGESAEAFIYKLNEFRIQNENIKNEISNVSYSIRNVAEEIRRAEERAIREMEEIRRY